MLSLLIVVVMAAHLLAMNVASAGPLFCIWLRGLRKPVAEIRIELGKSLAWFSLACFLVGMILGGILLLIPPSPGLLKAMGRFPNHAYVNIGLELLFTLACLLAYAMSWNKLRNHPLLHALLPLLASTNLLYHFPPLMAIIGKIASNPNWTALEVIDRPAYLKLMSEGEVLSLTVHFCFASIAVSAIALFVMYAKKFPSQETAPEDGPRVIRMAAVVALVASVLQLPVGIWLLSAIPNPARLSLMGGNLLASLYLVGGMLMTFVLLQHLAGIALGDVSSKSLFRVCGMLVVLVLLMTATLRATREAKLNNLPEAETKKATERIYALSVA